MWVTEAVDCVTFNSITSADTEDGRCGVAMVVGGGCGVAMVVGGGCGVSMVVEGDVSGRGVGAAV